MLEMNTSPRLRRVKHGYTSGARSLAGRSVTRLARTGITPNVLTTTGVSLCLAAAVLVPFENRADKLLVYWLAAGIFVVVDVAAVAGSFLVSYTRARAEALGLKGDVGLGSRAERVVLITAGLVFAPWGGLPWAIVALAATAWLTVVQRVLHVRKQLSGGTSGSEQR